MIKLLLVVGIMGAVVAGEKKHCPMVIGKTPFDETKFAGKWRIIMDTMHADKLSPACGTFDYQPTAEGFVMGYSALTPEGKELKADNYGTSIFKKPGMSSNSLSVISLPGKTIGPFSQAITTTDYDTYAVIIACRNTFDDSTKTFNKQLKAAIMSRNTTLPPDTLEVLKNVLSGYGVDLSTLTLVDHRKC